MSNRGRGRGRGGGGLTFSLESMGLNRGDILPPPILHPPEHYPPLDLKAVPPKVTEIDDYLLTLKQEFRTAMSASNFHINPMKEKPKIERYSDKYENNANVTHDNDFKIDWRLFPNELFSAEKRKTSKQKTKIYKDIDKKLNDLNADDEKEETEEQNKDDDDDDDDVADAAKETEEEIEEGTDYTMAYFDNGENYLDDSDDNLDEGPTY